MGARRRIAVAYALCVVLAIAFVFGSALTHSFLPGHDDGEYVLGNPLFRSAALPAVLGAFKVRPLGAWAPLHLMSYFIDGALWRDWPGGYVLGNLALHAANALLLAWLVLRLGDNRLAAAAAGLLFAVHPVQVEPVVWISQRKTVLSLALLLVSLHAWVGYCRATPEQRERWYAISLAAGLGALLSKAVAVILPGALALLDVPLGRLKFRPGWFAEKGPFVLAALAIAIVTVAGKVEVGSLSSESGHDRWAASGPFAYHGGSLLATFFTMATVLPRYLLLLVWPAHLSAVYLPPIRTRVDFAVAASLVLLMLLAAAGALLFRRAPRLFCWYGLFFLGLLPVSQIVPQVTLMNDRYLYLPMVGAAALAGEGLAFAWERVASSLRPALAIVAVGVMLGLSAQAHARVPVWRDDLALWSDATREAPRSPHAWYNLGRSQEEAGQTEAALASYLRALAVDDRDGDAAVNAGAIYLRRSELEKAAPWVERGAQLLPPSAEAQFNLALLRFLQGKFAEAEAPLRSLAGRCTAEALLGHVFTLTGRPGEALDRYGRAAAQGCADPEVAFYRAYARSEGGDLEAALADLAGAVPAAAQFGIGFLDRPTLEPLRAQPRFDALLRRFAGDQEKK